jgi:CheY-like chemotaxis protein
MSTHKAGRVVLVAELTQRWAEIVRALELDGVEFDLVGPRTPPSDVIRCTSRADGVAVVDLAADAGAGMATVMLCRRVTPQVPVIVVADNPSIELTRSIRLSGAFYLALHPLGIDEMRSVVTSAFEAIEAHRSSAITCHAKRRILVIDDDPDFRASTATLLEAYGYRVSTALSGKQGLDALRREPPDLVVVDVMMESDGAGYEVNQAVKYGRDFDALRHIPIVMVSSIPLEPAIRFQTAGEVAMITPNVYLTKPLDIPRFISEVRGLLGEHVAEPVGAAR